MTENTGPTDKNPPGKNASRIVARELCKFIAYCLVFYLLMGAVIAWSPIYSLVILRPEGKSDLYNIQIKNKEDVTFANRNGDTLHAWLFRSPGSNRIALVHHGNAGNLTNRLLIARDFLQMGISVFLYDYRGYGASTGKATVAGLAEDGQAAYDYITGKLGYRAQNIIVYGESIGTAVACRTALDRPCKAIILQSGLCSLPRVAYDGVCWLRLYPDWIFPEPRFDTASIISSFAQPVLFIHGAKDKLIPCHHSRDLFALASSPDKELVILPNAGHNDVQGLDEPVYFAALSRFINKISGGSTPVKAAEEKK